MKTKSYYFLILIVSSLFFTSCEDLLDEINTSGLTEAEIAEGLKEALKVGTDTSVANVTKLDGYYKDALIKVLLPQEANDVLTKLKSYDEGMLLYESSLKFLEEDLILSLNRAAEDAANEAKPIFIDAITSMTISDAINILHGSDTAATNYLIKKTYNSLTAAYSPKINTSLDKKLIGNQSTNEIWNTFVITYNDIATSSFNLLMGLETIKETNISTYATQKALTGLFTKVGDEEKNIRENPEARVNAILEKVFGELDK